MKGKQEGIPQFVLTDISNTKWGQIQELHWAVIKR